jgi:DNA repair protein RecO (recombination protein O)
LEKLKIKAIVINETSFKESSKILNLLTENKGIIGVISRGCKNIKSSLRSVSSKLTYGYFYINYKEDSLSVLTEVDVISDLKEIKTDLVKIGYSSYLVDLAKQVIKQNNNPDIFTILEGALLKINEGFLPNVITNIVELKYLSYLGVAPILDRCSVCSSEKSIVTVNSDSGGYVCKNCYTNQYICDSKTIKLLRMFLYVDLSKIKELNIMDKNIKEINKFLEDYYVKYTGLYLKPKSFLTQIKQN